MLSVDIFLRPFLSSSSQYHLGNAEVWRWVFGWYMTGQHQLWLPYRSITQQDGDAQADCFNDPNLYPSQKQVISAAFYSLSTIVHIKSKLCKPAHCNVFSASGDVIFKMKKLQILTYMTLKRWAYERSTVSKGFHFWIVAIFLLLHFTECSPQRLIKNIYGLPICSWPEILCKR